MSTDKAQQKSDFSEQIAKGVDETFIKLVYLSPFALLVLLISEEAREFGWIVIGLGIFIATLWTIFR